MMNRAIVFPGQGSQSVGMLADIASAYPEILHSFEQVSGRLGYDLWEMIQQGPDVILNQTIHTQVAMLTADVALYTLLQQQQAFQPQMMAGHSLGEYAALVCSDAISLVDAAALVQTRARLMQETVPIGVGAMAAIVGLTDEQVNDICEQVSNDRIQVMPANYNAVGQVVIAGHQAAVAEAIMLADSNGARLAKQIPVSVPCHCTLLKPAALQFKEYLSEVSFKIPNTAVVSNVDLSIYRSVDQIRTLLAQQLYSPVRWVETIQLFQKNGIETIMECGPGKVLSGLVKRIDKSLQVTVVHDELLFPVRP